MVEYCIPKIVKLKKYNIFQFPFFLIKCFHLPVFNALRGNDLGLNTTPNYCHFWELKKELKLTENNWKGLKKNWSYLNSHIRDILKKLKRTEKNWKELHNFSVIIAFFSFFYYVSHMTIFSYFKFFFYSQKGVQPPQKSVHPPSFQSQLISFHLRAIFETKKKGRHDCNEKDITPL